MGKLTFVAGSLVLAVSGCSSNDDFESSPIDVSGVYTASVTNREDTCGFPNWESGKTASDIKFTVTQQASEIDGTIDGVVGTLIELWLGSKTFEGTVEGDQLEAVNHGSRPFTQLQCTYTIEMKLQATLDGDALQGVLGYTPLTNHSPDCGALESCHALQDFAGTRPP